MGQYDKGGEIVDLQGRSRADGIPRQSGPAPGLVDNLQRQHGCGHRERQAQRVHARILAVPDCVGAHCHQKAARQGDGNAQPKLPRQPVDKSDGRGPGQCGDRPQRELTRAGNKVPGMLQKIAADRMRFPQRQRLTDDGIERLKAEEVAERLVAAKLLEVQPEEPQRKADKNDRQYPGTLHLFVQKDARTFNLLSLRLTRDLVISLGEGPCRKSPNCFRNIARAAPCTQRRR